MGKGDKKTRRGKLFMGSYGNTRPKSAATKIEKVVKGENAEKAAKAEKVEKTPKAEKPKAKAKK